MRVIISDLQGTKVEGLVLVLGGTFRGFWVAFQQGYPSQWTGCYYGEPQWRRFSMWSYFRVKTLTHERRRVVAALFYRTDYALGRKGESWMFRVGRWIEDGM